MDKESLLAHLRHLVYFFTFCRKKDIPTITKKISKVYGSEKSIEDIDIKKFVEEWYNKTQAGLELEYEEEKRETKDEIEILFEKDPRYTSEDIKQKLNISVIDVEERLQKLDYVNKCGIWIPCKLSEINLIDRISICDSLLKRNNNNPFLKRIIIGDERWISYIDDQNLMKFLSLPLAGSSKQDENLPLKIRKKLSVWWDWQGVVYHELHQCEPYGSTENISAYCARLDLLEKNIYEKRPELVKEGIIFHQDNVVSSVDIRKKFYQLNWEVLLYPPNSPDIAPPSYQLFKSLQTSLDNKICDNEDECKNHITDFLQKDQTFWENSILKLPEKWSEVISKDGAYIV